eukprot:m.454314 g.454314  ORF g.454314 m.454314 type:complete len:86 (+) comp56949_c1_seq1:758-1015(+)
MRTDRLLLALLTATSGSVVDLLVVPGLGGRVLETFGLNGRPAPVPAAARRAQLHVFVCVRDDATSTAAPVGHQQRHKPLEFAHME